LDAEVISAIFRREITNFQDPRIAALNPDRNLPDREIIPVHRADGSGTTSVFTTWLADEDETWASTLGAGTEVAWPAGTVGGPGNEGVATNITQNPGGIGYVNQSYAMVLELPQATVVNADGNPVYPTPEATTAALSELMIPDDFQFDILGVGGEGYPIAGTVWNFYWECGYAPQTAAQLRDFWSWAVREGDEAALALGYIPLDAALKQRVLAAITRIGSGDRARTGGSGDGHERCDGRGAGTPPLAAWQVARPVRRPAVQGRGHHQRGVRAGAARFHDHPDHRGRVADLRQGRARLLHRHRMDRRADP